MLSVQLVFSCFVVFPLVLDIPTIDSPSSLLSADNERGIHHANSMVWSPG